MAVHNFTETPATRGFAGLSAGLSRMPELEKISCSVGGNFWIHPLALMGKRIRSFYSDHGANSLNLSTVLAVHLGSIQHGIETSLLLQDSDGSDPYYADISQLTVIDVLPDSSSADPVTLPNGQPMLAGVIEERDATASKGVAVTVVDSGRPGLFW